LAGREVDDTIACRREIGRGRHGLPGRTIGQERLQLDRAAATLTLACQGTTTESLEPDAKKYPVSMGIVVNFTDRTVRGFYLLELLEIPVKITAANKVVAFGGQRKSPSTLTSIHGSIDRVTGDLAATLAVSEAKTSKIYSTTIYAQKCRPTQRMF
jgi:hypothetical protein